MLLRHDPCAAGDGGSAAAGNGGASSSGEHAGGGAAAAAAAAPVAGQKKLFVELRVAEVHSAASVLYESRAIIYIAKKKRPREKSI